MNDCPTSALQPLLMPASRTRTRRSLRSMLGSAREANHLTRRPDGLLRVARQKHGTTLS
jgi:hypothetical protein